MSDEKKTRDELKEKITELLNIDPALIKEYTKLYARAKKHGDLNVKLQGGRKKVSEEHKKEVYRKRYEKQKQALQEERERLTALGINYKKKMGRSRKNPLQDV